MNNMTLGPLQLQAIIETRPFKAPFRITGYTFTEVEALVVSLHANGNTGHGEAEGVYYHRDTAAVMLAQIEALRRRIEPGITHEQLLEWLPAGGARNALDCALWDIEARCTGTPAWKLSGLESPPRPLLTTFTIGAGAPVTMAEEARSYNAARALKLKLTDDDLNADRVRAVRAARPDVWLMIDANQGFTRKSFAQLLPALVEAGVALVEQPFPVGREADLDGLNSPIRIAADESVQDRNDLERLSGRFDVVNIKLDKCGGLTEALVMAQKIRQAGLGLMVGNMGGTSLAMAPAFVLGQLCEIVDLDGPVSLASDRSPGVSYENGCIYCPEALWGTPIRSEV